MAKNTNTLTYNNYAPKSTGSQIDWAKISYNDPYFALGYMAGSTLANNYNKRGEQKILNAAADDLNNLYNPETAVSPEQQNAALSAMVGNEDAMFNPSNFYNDGNMKNVVSIDGRQPAAAAAAAAPNIASTGTQAASQWQPVASVGTHDIQQDPRMQALDQIEMEAQLRNGQQPVAAVSGNNSFFPDGVGADNVSNGGAVINTAPEAIIPSAFQLRQAQELEDVGNAIKANNQSPAIQQMLSQVSMNLDGSQPGDNGQYRTVTGISSDVPESQQPANVTNAAAGQPAMNNGRIEFDKLGWLMKQRQAMLKDGFTEDRIANTMSTLEMMADSYENKVKDHNTQLDLQEIVGTDPTTPQFQAQLVRLYQDNPEAANLFVKNAVFYPTLWKDKQWYKHGDYQFKLGEKKADNNMQRAEQLAQYRSDLALQQKLKEMQVRAQAFKALKPDATPQEIAYFALGYKGGGGPGKSLSKLLGQTDGSAILSELRQNSVRDGDATMKSGEDNNYKPNDSYRAATIKTLVKGLRAGAKPEELYMYLASIENNLSPEEISDRIDAAVRQSGIGTWYGPPEAETPATGGDGGGNGGGGGTPAQPSPGSDSSGGFFSWLQKAGDKAYKSIYGDRPDPALDNIYRLKLSEWTQALQYNQQAGDQGLDKAGMMDAARKRYGNETAERLFKDTDWSAFNLE